MPSRVLPSQETGPPLRGFPLTLSPISCFSWRSSLLWLTKAVVLRCGPPSSLAQCTRLLMHIASCSHTPLDGATPPAQVRHSPLHYTRFLQHLPSPIECLPC